MKIHHLLAAAFSLLSLLSQTAGAQSSALSDEQVPSMASAPSMGVSAPKLHEGNHQPENHELGKRSTKTAALNLRHTLSTFALYPSVRARFGSMNDFCDFIVANRVLSCGSTAWFADTICKEAKSGAVFRWQSMGQVAWQRYLIHCEGTAPAADTNNHEAHLSKNYEAYLSRVVDGLSKELERLVGGLEKVEKDLRKMIIGGR